MSTISSEPETPTNEGTQNLPARISVKPINLTLPDASRKPKGLLVAPVSSSEAPVIEPKLTVETPSVVAPPTPDSLPEAKEGGAESQVGEDAEPDEDFKPLTRINKIIGSSLIVLGLALLLPTAYGIGMLDADLYINTNPVFKDASILLTTIMVAGAIIFSLGLFTFIPSPAKPKNSRSLSFIAKVISFGHKAQKHTTTNSELLKTEPLEVVLPSE